MSKRDFPVYRPEENAPYTGRWADANTGHGSELLPQPVEYPSKEEQAAWQARYEARSSDQTARPVRDVPLVETHGHLDRSFWSKERDPYAIEIEERTFVPAHGDIEVEVQAGSGGVLSWLFGKR